MSNTKQSWFRRANHFLMRKPHSQKQLVALLRDARQRQLIDNDALHMIEGVLAVSDKNVRDVMVPKSQMLVIHGKDKPMDVLPTVVESQHSRFPVVGENPDKIIGILLAKDLLSLAIEKNHMSTVSDFMRQATFVPESKRLDVLLKEFRLNRNHMAIVVDEYGGAAGLVTIEDVLEEIVGEIEDEHDTEEKEPDIRSIAKNTFLVNALTSIDVFNKHFKTSYAGGDFDTMGGLIVQKFGHLPKRNEIMTWDHFQVKVIKATKRSVELLQFKILKSIT